MKKSFLLGIDRFLSGKFLKQLAVAFIPFLSVLIVVSLVYIFNNKRDGSIGEKVAQAFVDMTNPETVRDSVYYSTQLIPKQIEQSVTEIEENYHKPSFGTVIGLVVVYFLGAVFFTGLLIATFTNIWRARAEKFRRGKVDYHFSGHIVFLGYNSLVPGLIQKICEERDDNIKEVRIVVGVENNASTVCDKIKNRLFNDYRDRVVVLQADGCNMKDLERLRISFAKEVYIIGEHDDAYNLKCYRTIYELSLCGKSRETEMPQCYVNLHSQATLTLFRTYASSGELGIDFANFHSFSFYDEWARTMIQKEWIFNEELQDHFFIAGMTEMGVALARKVALLCQKPNGRPTIITLIDDEASKKAKNFIIQHQDFFDRIPYRIQTKTTNYNHIPVKSVYIPVTFEFINGDLFDETIRKEISNSTNNYQQTTTLAICYDDSQQNIVSGLNLPNNCYGDDSKAHVWLYQPTFGDLGKFLRSKKHTNFITFGTSGDELDIKNTECVSKAPLINHFLLYEGQAQRKKSQLLKDNEVEDIADLTGEPIASSLEKQSLTDAVWESADISRRWVCIRLAEFIPFLTRYKDDTSSNNMIELERKRSTTDYYMFGKEGFYALPNIFSDYIKVLQEIIVKEELKPNEINTK